MEAAALDILRSGHIASGPKVVELEEAFTTITGREHIVSTKDLTSAILIALQLAGVCAGDEVAVLAFSCLQSNSPIAHLGARPVWIDIDPGTMSMSVEDLSAKLTPSIKAVMVYHIAGYPADIEKIAALCRDRGLPLIEDCNNAIGAKLNKCQVGVFGDFAVYSLYPNRQINGIDGGMLATPDAKTASHATRIRRFGIDPTSFRDTRGEINPNSDVCEIGLSAALSHLNAAVALAQLNTLESRVSRTQAVAARMTKALLDSNSLQPIKSVSGAEPAFWGLFVQSTQRDSLLAHLKANDIKASILHQRNDWYTGFGTPRADLPGTALAMKQSLALPCGWWMTDDDIETILNSVTEFDEGK